MTLTHSHYVCVLYYVSLMASTIVPRLWTCTYEWNRYCWCSSWHQERCPVGRGNGWRRNTHVRHARIPNRIGADARVTVQRVKCMYQRWSRLHLLFNYIHTYVRTYVPTQSRRKMTGMRWCDPRHRHSLFNGQDSQHHRNFAKLNSNTESTLKSAPVSQFVHCSLTWQHGLRGKFENSMIGFSLPIDLRFSLTTDSQSSNGWVACWEEKIHKHQGNELEEFNVSGS
jgi:hypothetical protein